MAKSNKDLEIVFEIMIEFLKRQNNSRIWKRVWLQEDVVKKLLKLSPVFEGIICKSLVVREIWLTPVTKVPIYQ